MVKTIPSVEISLLKVPRVGHGTILIRTTEYDRSLINRAASILGLRQAEFLRLVTVRASEALIKIQEDEDFGHQIDIEVPNE
jgi:uncharacterized protein (DUF1778 family)